MKTSVLFAVSFLLASSFQISQAVLSNCTSAPCDIKTCSNTTTECRQICSATPCKTSCTSPAGCRATCPLGGCSKMECIKTTIAPTVTPPPGVSDECSFTCKENCPDMNCYAKRCYPHCTKDNCKMTCDGPGIRPLCFPRCLGKGCEISCKSWLCQVSCNGGSCKVKFAKRSRGTLSCDGGNCSLVCAKGSTTCAYQGPCPNCTAPVFVDDPFAKPTVDPPAKSSAGMVDAFLGILFVAAMHTINMLFF